MKKIKRNGGQKKVYRERKERERLFSIPFIID